MALPAACRIHRGGHRILGSTYYELMYSLEDRTPMRQLPLPPFEHSRYSRYIVTHIGHKLKLNISYNGGC